MIKIRALLVTLMISIGMLGLAPTAQAHIILCELTVYAPTVVGGIGVPDKIVYGVKHKCTDNMDQMFVEAQAMIRNTVTGRYDEYGAPTTYQCGYGGRPACKREWTTFDWTWCNGAHHYKTRGYAEGFHDYWSYAGPTYVPSVGGKWINCVDLDPQTEEDLQVIKEFREWEER